MAASNRPYANRILPAWMWPSSAAAATAAAEDFERKKTVHEDTARQYRVAAGQLEQMTEGAMSEAMVTEHQLLAVDHTNIARIDDEFAAMGRRLAEMAHSLSAHLDDIDYRSATGDLIVPARAPCRHHYRSARESGSSSRRVYRRCGRCPRPGRKRSWATGCRNHRASTYR